jgi:hypothetical protein
MDVLPRGPLGRDLQDEYSAEDVRRIRARLDEAGTFRFPTLPTGLFAVVENPQVGVRETVQIAHALFVTGEVDLAVGAMRSLAAFLLTQQPKIRGIIAGEVDAADPMQRPHVLFDGVRLAEWDGPLVQDQNDALGYFLWLFARLVLAGRIQPTDAEWSLLVDLPLYFRAVRYWEDEESGHWEGIRKVSASSIGVVVTGLVEYARLLQHPAAGPALQRTGVSLDGNELAAMLEAGGTALEAILPAECVQADPRQRSRYDAALLFLVYPLKLLDGPMADAIVEDVTTHLVGEYGIRRFLNDSGRRDADLPEPGLEDQWCLFDPIISVIYGARFMKYRDPADRQFQTRFLNRSLCQLTEVDGDREAYRCPEHWRWQDGVSVPGPISPSLWAQANLRLALHWAELAAET